MELEQDMVSLKLRRTQAPHAAKSILMSTVRHAEIGGMTSLPRTSLAVTPVRHDVIGGWVAKVN
jgi:hypothetical protein